jgi:two-component system CheB/CheR fusion protein
VAGCATGEEAYSVAMICSDLLGGRRGDIGVQIFATDLDIEAIKQARRGQYNESALELLPATLRERHLLPVGEQFEVTPELRELVVFSRHDVTRDPPFPRVDLTVCRNLLIYLKPAAQARVMRAFHFSLLPGGLLFLGQSESALGHEALFKPLDKELRLYQRLDGNTSWMPTLAVEPGTGLPVVTPPPMLARRSAGPELTLLRQAAQAYLPPCLLLDERLQVLQMHGDLTPFFALRSGPQAFDVLSLARSEVATPLRLLCALLGNEREAPLQSELTLHEGRRRQHWLMQLRAFAGPLGQRWSVLAFLAQRPRRSPRGQAPSDHSREELAHAREHMKGLVEQLEAFNEEMQALNEEAQATNEELQASNEELESTNEELQATNQELATVNAELNYQWRAHRQLAEELQSILDSIDLPQLVIDAQLNIRRYNRAAAQLFRLNPGCEGMPLSTIALPPGLQDLSSAVRQVERSASPMRLALPPTDAGSEYVLHLSHNLIDGERRGIVLTLVDNTERAQAERHTRQVEGRLLSVLTHGRAMVAIKDLSGRYEFANAPYAAFFGVAADALVGRTDTQALSTDTAAALRQRDLEFMQQGQPIEREERFTRQGRERAWWATRFGLFDAQGVLEAICIQAVDLSGGQEDDSARRIAAKIFDVSNEGIVIVSAAGELQRVNTAFATLTGFSSEELRGRPLQALDSGRHGFAFIAGLLTKVREQGRWQGEAWLRRKDGKVFPGWLSLSALHDAEGHLTHVVGLLTDISALTETRESLRRLATEDPLTGLPNRSLLLDRLAHAVESAARQRTELALCFIDLDNFKTINDSLGHDAGDEVLRLAAHRIGSHVRSADTLARLGGDEFVLLLENTNRHESLQTIERIARSMGENVTLSGNVISTSCSIGVALYPEDGDDAQALLSHADAAMYRAKRSGRARYEYFSPEVGDSVRTRMQIESGLRQALERQELCLHYQPQVDPSGTRLLGVEALLRWNSPNGGSISPAIFLPIAEESSLIDHIGDWVIRTACARLASWRRAGHAVPRLSVNISPRQLRDRSFAEKLQQVLLLHGLPGEGLVLEITESALLHSSDEVTQLLRRIDQMGVQFSLDDFGTGYSSLAALRALPLSELKIDRSFVHGVFDQRDDREIVDAIIGLGGSLGLRLVAEGVETPEQLQHFHRVGHERPVDLALQGFRIARPLPDDDFIAWLDGLERQQATAPTPEPKPA